MVRHDAAPAQHQAVRAAHPAGRRHGLDHRRGAGGGSYDRGPARQLPHPHVRVHQPWPVRVRDLLPGLPRCERQGRRADLGHERTDSSGAVRRGALPRERYDRAPHRRLHLRGDRERAGDGARPDAGVRRQGAGQRPLGPRQLRPHAPSASAERGRSEAMSAATAGSRAQLVEKARQFPAGAFIGYGVVASGVGAAVFLWALTTGQAARAWQAYHVNFMFWTGLAQGLVVFAATQKLAKGHWSGLLIRFAESAAAFLVIALVLFLGLALGRAYIFSWLHEPRPDIGGWLTSRFFFPRNGLILAALVWLSWRFVRHDIAPDVRELADGRPADRLEGRDRIARKAAILIVGYAFGYSLLAFDLMMSLAHKWVSNLFGAFYFMGSFLAALMLLAVLFGIRAGELGWHLVGALSRDRSIDQRRCRPRHRHSGTGRHRPIRRSIPHGDGMVRRSLPDDLASPRRGYAGARGALAPFHVATLPGQGSSVPGPRRRSTALAPRHPARALPTFLRVALKRNRNRCRRSHTGHPGGAMRSALWAGAVGLMVVACGSSTSPYGGSGGTPACTSTATQACMINTSFSPTNLTVSVGTTVTWKNGDGFAHTVNSATGSPGTAYSSGNVAAGGTFQHTFSAAGTYPYYCMIHGLDGMPPTGMHGTITVQ